MKTSYPWIILVASAAALLGGILGARTHDVSTISASVMVLGIVGLMVGTVLTLGEKQP